MRIIAGSARGRRILSVPKELPVRPISARIRQSLFDILRPRITGARLLDLFAGTGAVGLEALSRGAQSVSFVEMDPRCVKVIEKNLERSGMAERGRVFRANALASLSWLPYRSGAEAFDLVFLGPPYVDAQKRPLRYTQAVLENVAASGLLAPDGWLVAQHHQKEPVHAPKGLELFRRSKYGDTRLSFLRRAGWVGGPLSSERGSDDSLD